ncbi:hypothetical protein JAAARDRAFT_41095 [Jaapia argillacea MUCL 33604]|uniref:Uncharacterized protein n=1 Tax=Jaapia argillacea MUCL 33604 TaxID=933084 RepID=A0A067P971_9AGAM|nr:hypothetical protein JAAARDRAFT_41095 [Jaapia argillacea MUCL 33604]
MSEPVHPDRLVDLVMRLYAVLQQVKRSREACVAIFNRCRLVLLALGDKVLCVPDQTDLSEAVNQYASLISHITLRAERWGQVNILERAFDRQSVLRGIRECDAEVEKYTQAFQLTSGISIGNPQTLKPETLIECLQMPVQQCQWCRWSTIEDQIPIVRDFSSNLGPSAEEIRRNRREVRVLLFGLSGSGKSTILNKLRLSESLKFSEDELDMYSLVIKKVLIRSAYALRVAMQKHALRCSYPSNEKSADRIGAYAAENIHEPSIPQVTMDDIRHFLADPSIASIRKLARVDYCDNADFFLDEAQRICEPGYRPSDEDILRARKPMSNEIQRLRIGVAQLSVHLLEIGHLTLDYKQWVRHLDGITSVVFCSALSDYDTHMVASLELFDMLINSPWFYRSSVVLLLTKTDIFKGKLPQVPMERFFPNYTGASDANKAAKYLLWRHLQCNRQQLCCYPHLTSLTDNYLRPLVFAAIKETILHNALRDSGII